MFSNIEYCWRLPRLIELRLFNLRFDFEIVLAVHLIIVHALQKVLFAYAVNAGKLFTDSIEFQRPGSKDGSIAVNVIAYFGLRLRLNCLQQFFEMFLVTKVVVCVYLKLTASNDIHTLPTDVL